MNSYTRDGVKYKLVPRYDQPWFIDDVRECLHQDWQDDLESFGLYIKTKRNSSCCIYWDLYCQGAGVWIELASSSLDKWFSELKLAGRYPTIQRYLANGGCLRVFAVHHHRNGLDVDVQLTDTFSDLLGLDGSPIVQAARERLDEKLDTEGTDLMCEFKDWYQEKMYDFYEQLQAFAEEEVEIEIDDDEGAA